MSDFVWKISRTWKMLRSTNVIIICDKGYYCTVSKEFRKGFFKSSRKLLTEMENSIKQKEGEL